MNPKTKRKPRRLGQDYSGYIYILPATLFILCFAFLPICMSIYYSLTDYNVVQAPKFCGLKNYITLFHNANLITALKNTVWFTIIIVPFTTIISMGLAAIIVSRRHSWFNSAVKSSLFIPVISSAILVGTLWRIMYSSQGGLINSFLGLFGIDPINWLGQTDLALPAVAVVEIWKNVGYFLVIYIAAILDIPQSLYEASAIDGATGWQQFRTITLPLLRPTTFLVVTLCTIWSFQTFELVYTMTGGGPGRSTMTLVYVIYNAAFHDFKMGYACAIALVLFALILIVSLIQRIFLDDTGKED